MLPFCNSAMAVVVNRRVLVYARLELQHEVPMPFRSSQVLALAIVALSASASQGRTAPATDMPPAMQKVFDCRALTDNTARLACYDANVGQLSEARTRGDIAMVDREQVKDARRKLFGFTLPSLNLFTRDDKADGDRKAARADEVQEITAKITKVGRNPEGGWVVTLEDGARWEQTDAMIFGRNPKPGATATIKRGALGSFKMSIDGSPSCKARRVG